MSASIDRRPAAPAISAVLGVAVAGYAACAAATWLRYGHPRRPGPEEDDPLLDRFMPVYDVVERHRTRVAAPAPVTLAVARTMDLFHLPVVRAIIKAREFVLGATGIAEDRPRGLLAEAQALGWSVLADVPGREVAVGAVTRPWEADVTFRSVAAGDFAAFDEPDYVKIVWTLRADPLGPEASIFRTETRAAATDRPARTRFRRYWAFFAPGIWLIRAISLAPLKADAERQARGLVTPSPPGPERAVRAG
jgi:hypothetical protein